MAEDALRADLEARGWWDRRLQERGRRLTLIGAGTLILAALAGAVALVGGEPWGILATLLLAGAGTLALVIGTTFPATTAVGAAVAAPWKGLRAGLRAARRDQTATLDLDAILPYAVALGATGALDRRLKSASAEGRVPLAFRQGLQGDAWAGGFYPYFASFAATSHPGEGGASAGGTAAGGAGAGGSV